jgi:hypothetical protein
MICLGQGKINIFDYIEKKWDINSDTYRSDSLLIIFLNTGRPMYSSTIFDTTRRTYNDFSIRYVFDENELELIMDQQKRCCKRLNSDFILLEVTIDQLMNNGNLSFCYLLFIINPKTYNSNVKLKHVQTLGKLTAILEFDAKNSKWNWVN